MSAKIFKRSQRGKLVERGSRYKPGEAPMYEALADRLVTEYLERGVGAIRWKSDGGKIVEEFSSQVRAVECGDGQDFLDTVVERLGFYGSISHLKHADSFISPLVNLLYEGGLDSFTLDFTGWARAPGFLAQGIVGTGDRKLSLHYKVAPTLKSGKGYDVSFIGWESEHIVLRLSGTAVCSAYNCKNSEFIFERSVKNIGQESTQDCVFRLEDVVRVTHLRSSSFYGNNFGLLREGIPAERSFIPLRFFVNRNKLLIPDGPDRDTWKPVYFG